MQHDPAIDHSGRLHDFLDKAISDFKRPQMTEPATIIQPNQFKQEDKLVTSLTGVGTLASVALRRIAAAKARHIAANTKVDAAFVKLDGASEAVERLATKVEAEADAALAQIGQISNMAPD